MDREKTSRIEIRIDDERKALLMIQAKRANMTISRYLMLLIDSAILPLKMQLQTGAITYDDLETLFNNKLQLRELFDK